MAELRIALTIESLTALSVGAGGSSGTIADKSIQRDGWGRPLIPGSQVKGRVRHTAEGLLTTLGLPTQQHFDDDDSAMNPIRRLFGSPNYRSPLRFVDLPCTLGAGDQVSQNRPSVSLNRRRGTAEDQRLLVQEVSRETLSFAHERAITGSLDADELPYAALLWAALRLTDRWGGAKSRGLGWSDVTATVYWQNAQVEPDTLTAALYQLPELAQRTANEGADRGPQSQ